MIRQIPNFITLMNLLCGSIGIKILLSNPSVENFAVACACVYIGAILDFFDGMVARLLHVKSEIGKQLDSLADVVTFGLLPSLILHELALRNMDDSVPVIVVMLPFLVVVFSAYRLANFNVDSRQSEEFIGLPTPANAVFISTFVWILVRGNDYGAEWVAFFLNPYALAVVSLLSSFLMVSNIPFLSLKKTGNKLSNQFKLLLMLISITILLVLKAFAGVPILIVYAVLSLVHEKKSSAFGG